MESIADLQKRLRKFAEERDWEQFHSPKNLSMALSAEVGELLEIFQWLTDEQSKDLKDNPQDKNRAAEEIADIFLYLLRLADRLEVDLISAAINKIEINSQKYPTKLSKGNAVKYSRRNDA